jgi:hypothetical protein
LLEDEASMRSCYGVFNWELLLGDKIPGHVEEAAGLYVEADGSRGLMRALFVADSLGLVFSGFKFTWLIRKVQ